MNDINSNYQSTTMFNGAEYSVLPPTQIVT